MVRGLYFIHGMRSYWGILCTEKRDLVCILKGHGCCVENGLLGQGQERKQGAEFISYGNSKRDRYRGLDWSGSGVRCKKSSH